MAPCSFPAALNEGRGRNPGDTRASTGMSRSGPLALNEGRGRNPGDTGQGTSRRCPRGRSTKAGAVTPATRGPC